MNTTAYKMITLGHSKAEIEKAEEIVRSLPAATIHEILKQEESFRKVDPLNYSKGVYRRMLMSYYRRISELANGNLLAAKLTILNWA